MSALGRHVALIGFMGAGKSTLGEDAAGRLGRPFRDLDQEIEQAAGTTIPRIFAEQGEPVFRQLEESHTLAALAEPEPSVLALGGGAVTSARVREEVTRRAVIVLVDVEPEEAWRRVSGGDRPLAQDVERFHALYAEREPLYRQLADATARDADDVVLAAGGVHVSAGSLELLGDLIGGDGGVGLVADARVDGIHGPAAQVALGRRLQSTHELPVGEDAKTIVAIERLWRELRLDRRGTLVALGGGTTTDAAGFAAATYLRGVDWAAVPTTLVGQVDAAIGGKTAINLPEGKNLVGAFHWPARTVIDPALLRTLPEHERTAGLAEVVKTGLLAGEPYWELPDAELVRRCAAYKTAVCVADPHERGVRAVLNLGHTFGHALEAAASYEAVSHGHAVALGLTAALKLSGNPGSLQVVRDVLDPRPVRVDPDRAWAALERDKKFEHGRLRLVLLPEPGRPLVAEQPEADVRAALNELIAN
jgi:3-dehydroquinate synthetase